MSSKEEAVENTMAEVLAEHRLGHTIGHAVHCACDPEVGYSPDRFYAHQAEMLEVSGFGSTEEDLDEYHNLMMKQGAILRKVADALNGPPGPLHSWSHHDLGEKAGAMVLRHGALVSRLRAALRLISPDEITPMGVRVLEKMLDEAVGE